MEINIIKVSIQEDNKIFKEIPLELKTLIEKYDNKIVEKTSNTITNFIKKLREDSNLKSYKIYKDAFNKEEICIYWRKEMYYLGRIDFILSDVKPTGL